MKNDHPLVELMRIKAHAPEVKEFVEMLDSLLNLDGIATINDVAQLSPFGKDFTLHFTSKQSKLETLSNLRLILQHLIADQKPTPFSN